MGERLQDKGPSSSEPNNIGTAVSIQDESSSIKPGVGGEFERTPDMICHPHATDLGNAQNLVIAYGSSLRYCWPWRTWFVWDGTRWKRDETGLVHRRAKETVHFIYIRAAGRDGKAIDIDKRRAEHALRSESSRALNAMVDLARSEPGIPVLPDELDSDPWLLNVLNGTLDLRTGQLKRHDKRDLITRVTPAAYDPEARAPTWGDFLNRIMGGNPQLMDFLQRAVGYSLTGKTSERCLFFLHGQGANGKTTFLETIKTLMGEYGLRTPTETLLIHRGNGIPNDIARLCGVRFVIASESEEGQRFAEATIKDLTGNDTVTARFLHAEFFDFRPECKVWLASNHKPVIRGTDKAIWDRIKLIPFTVTIPEPEQDPGLLDKLREELPGILSWAVEGALSWRESGLGVPEEVRTATASYREEMDILGSFLADCCVISPTAQATAKELGEIYRGWCERNGEKPVGKRSFGMRLAERGFDSYRGTGGTRTWLGIGLNSDVRIPQDETR